MLIPARSCDATSLRCGARRVRALAHRAAVRMRLGWTGRVILQERGHYEHAHDSAIRLIGSEIPGACVHAGVHARGRNQAHARRGPADGHRAYHQCPHQTGGRLDAQFALGSPSTGAGTCDHLADRAGGTGAGALLAEAGAARAGAGAAGGLEFVTNHSQANISSITTR
jgi:hypothetical protein